MQWALLAVLLAQSSARPGVAVLVSRRAGVTPAQATEITREVEAALTANGVPVLDDSAAWTRRAVCINEPDPAACDADNGCLASLARKLEVPLVVGVELGLLDQELALHLAALEAASGRVVADKTVLTQAPGDLRALLVAELADFSKTVAAAVPLPAPLPLAAAPIPPVEVKSAPVSSGLRGWAWAPAVAGGVLAAGGLYYSGQAQAKQSALTDPRSAAGIGLAQAHQLRDEGIAAQARGTALLIGAGVALAASGAMLYFGAPEEVKVTFVAFPGEAGLAASVRLP